MRRTMIIEGKKDNDNRRVVGDDRGVCEKNTPLQKKTPGSMRLIDTKSGGG